MTTAKHKRGDTFDRSGALTMTVNGTPVTNLTGWTGTCQISTGYGSVITTLTFAWLDASQSLARVYAPAGTNSWPVGAAVMDIQLTSPSGVIVSTDTSQIEIVEGVTHV